MSKYDEILQRLVKIETLLDNHLKHHEKVNLFILFPIVTGIVVLLVKAFFFKGG